MVTLKVKEGRNTEAEFKYVVVLPYFLAPNLLTVHY